MWKHVKKSSMATTVKKLTMENLNPNVIKAEYAVRGYIPTLAGEIKQKLKLNQNQFPFKNVCEMNIGNPLIFDTNPVWTSRLLGSAEYFESSPEKQINSKKNKDENILVGNISFSNDADLKDALKQIKAISTSSPIGITGFDGVKKEISRFISHRDGFEQQPNRVFVSNGASFAILSVLRILLTKKKSRIMTPIPQYPLYSGLIELLGGELVPYYLNESDNWNVSIEEIRSKVKLNQTKTDSDFVSAIVLINPGNPTGNIFDVQKMKEILEFAHQTKMVVLADEVYQENIYSNKPWSSFRKVLFEMDSEIRNSVKLISFHSLSKGVLSECGLRGGYMDFTNFTDKEVEEYTLHIKNSWANNPGQIGMMLKVMFLSGEFQKVFPRSFYEQFLKEYKSLFESLKKRALLTSEMLNNSHNISCNPIEGAMYAFCKLELSDRFQKKAAKEHLHPDVFYCQKMLERSGICLVPGSGFKQQEGTFHFRTTILPSPDDFYEATFRKLLETHSQIINEYN